MCGCRADSLLCCRLGFRLFTDWLLFALWLGFLTLSFLIACLWIFWLDKFLVVGFYLGSLLVALRGTMLMM